MKLANIFKKENKTNKGIIINKIEKTQLSKVIGGLDTIIDTTIDDGSTDKAINEKGVSSVRTR